MSESALPGPEPENKDRPWRDEDLLRELYHEKGLSTFKIAERFNCDQGTVYNWLDKHEIETRSLSEAQQVRAIDKPANYRTSQRGYVGWYSYVNDETEYCQVHRLLAVAEYGFDEVCDKHVHHKNEIRWDNRPDNIEVLSPTDHVHEHCDIDEAPWTDAENFPAVWSGEAAKQLADQWGCHLSTVYKWANEHGVK